MRSAALGLTAVAALLASGPAAAAPSRDWSHMVAETPDGGFRVGNPAAKVRLVEYGSLACPHCRHFEETGYKPLIANYVRTGRVSYEFRNLLISAPDVSATLLTRCAGAAKFFPMAEVVFATQPDWEKRIADLSDADKAAIDAMPNQQQILRLASVTGLVAVAARFGVTPARARQCLIDAKALQHLLDVDKAANDHGVTHTPTFIINGKVSEAATWDDLEPEIKSAVGG
ncbi:thioredoxin domain-containing protein [Sphingomonas sp.]|uniref:DsbA family protein n=1 Tax=Sphingomonas sp. TaxID=28214 RepID=UPI0025FD31C3|nr:thioredoxin domain-containing protein [Sphingomonas sp.]MBV9528234.1 thioredoxin domain-containing protein [Sphingomonas sp.]